MNELDSEYKYHIQQSEDSLREGMRMGDPDFLAAAQVHATLAQSAATRMVVELLGTGAVLYK